MEILSQTERTLESYTWPSEMFKMHFSSLRVGIACSETLLIEKDNSDTDNFCFPDLFTCWFMEQINDDSIVFQLDNVTFY